MRKSLTYKILAAVLAAGSLGLYAAAPAAADDYTVKKDSEIISSGTFTNVYGNGHSFTITGGKIINVYGVGNVNYDKDASGGNVTINGNADIAGAVFGGYADGGNAYDNEIIISGSANIENADLYGSNYSSDYGNTGNTLTINGWSGSTNSVQNFNDIAFKNIDWNDEEPVLRITAGNADDLDNTTIDTIHIAGGSNINVGESMTLIESGNNTNLGLTEGNVTDTFTAGVAREGLGSTSVENGNVTFNVSSIKLSSQAVSAAQTRAASAAFVNQGTDLISDSLDTISRDDNYGVKTFAAVHGNRSKYDVADDIKINGSISNQFATCSTCGTRLLRKLKHPRLLLQVPFYFKFSPVF